MLNILIIEKDPAYQSIFREALKDKYRPAFWPDGGEIGAKLKSTHFDAVFIDLQMTQVDPFDLLDRIKSSQSQTPVIMVSQEERAELVVRAIKQGAFDFLVKPVSPAKIRLTLEQALELGSLRKEIDYLRHEQEIIYDFDQIIARSTAMQKVIQTLKKYALTDSTILITGETGTGKSFLAGTIHFNSPRRNRPFIRINCSNIPETLLESELFGHEKGAFTGAEKTRVGRFEQAHGGSLFLDEIGELTLALQVKLLRVIEEKSFERVGGNRTIHADVRIIAASNRDLADQVAKGNFREDLYYRINVLTVQLPPLRERPECIEPLVDNLLDRKCRAMKKRVKVVAPEVMDWIKSYPWPGNIRQLANVIERAVILEEGPVVYPESISLPRPVRPAAAPSSAGPACEALVDHEKDVIIRSLEENLWIQKDAARQLGISPRVLNHKIKKHGITHPRWRKHK